MARVWFTWAPLDERSLSHFRFWGREFDYDGSVVCIRRGGVAPRKGNNARGSQQPVASTSERVGEQEFLDDEQEEETDGAVVQDESFNANWSKNFMCVADPFIVTKVGGPPSSRWCSSGDHLLLELRRPDQQVHLYSVRSRMQKH